MYLTTRIQKYGYGNGIFTLFQVLHCELIALKAFKSPFLFKDSKLIPFDFRILNLFQVKYIKIHFNCEYIKISILSS